MFIKLEKEITDSQIQTLFDLFIEDIESQLEINIEDIDPISLEAIFEAMVEKADKVAF